MQMFCYSWKKKPDTRGQQVAGNTYCFIMAQELRVFIGQMKEENVWIAY